MYISLRAARVNANLTQKEAAKQLGMSDRKLFNLEKGIGLDTITWKMLEKIERVYHISRDCLDFLSEQNSV